MANMNEIMAELIGGFYGLLIIMAFWLGTHI
jgi:hypothetical protein